MKQDKTRSVILKINQISASQPLLESPTNKISFAFSAPLLEEIKNLLTSQWNQGDFAYVSISHFIRQSLIAYREKKIKLDLTFPRSRQKKDFTVRWPESDLLNFYYSLPLRKRVLIVEASMWAYFQLVAKKT